jgi:hypothetical protein
VVRILRCQLVPTTAVDQLMLLSIEPCHTSSYGYGVDPV